MERALGHAAELIASFKQVSADRLSEQRREFDLASTVEEILATLRPGFRATPYQLISRVDAGIAMDSYPGLLTQVISNLATNAKLHAFDGRLEGTVTIHGESQGDKIMMTFSDDGHGVAQSIRARIFDPFFTTRMGRGGTGLGLSIVHSLVTHGLGGSIHIEPGSMQGTCFVMVFPRIAPHHPSTPLDTAPLGWTG
jgi:signal transduction histidine kinase